MAASSVPAGINISQAAKKVVFCGTLTAGGLRTDLSEGQLRVVTEGKHHKFIEKVHQITFNAELALEARPGDPLCDRTAGSRSGRTVRS